MTSRVEGRENDGLLSSVGGRGFPTIVAMDHEGKVLARAGRRDISGFNTMMESGASTAKELAELRKNAKSGKPQAVNALISKEIEVGRVDMAMAKEFLAKKSVSADNKKKLNTILNEAKVGEIMKLVGQDPKTHIVAGEKFAKMINAGFDFPAGRAKLNAHFFASKFAKEKGDVALMTKCVEAFKSAKNVRPAFVENLQKDLDAMKKK